MIVQLKDSWYEVRSISIAEGYALLYDTETGRIEVWYIHEDAPACYTIEISILKSKIYLEFWYTPN